MTSRAAEPGFLAVIPAVLFFLQDAMRNSNPKERVIVL